MKKRILLVEYDLPTIETIKEILSHSIFDITIADEGEVAKDLLKNNKFDLMISAAMLPKFHGFNLSQYVASNYPDTKIIIISGVYKGLDYKHQAITQYKANEFFEKPLIKPNFKKSVLNHLDISEKDLTDKSGFTTTQLSAVDTKKIPTIKKMQENENQLTSEDIFGDIIEDVEKIKTHKIDLNNEIENEPIQTKKKPKEIPEEEKLKIKEVSVEKDNIEQPKERGFRRIDTAELNKDLEDIGKMKEPKKDDKKYKTIEDEISKKFEETLSGLGLSEKKPAVEKIPIQEQEVKEPEVKVVEKEIKEEVPKKKPPRKKVPEDEIGGYDILGLIARGGMAEIYKAKKKGVKGFEKIIAIKKILSGYGEDDRYIEMFVDEAKIAAELSHPNIVQIHDLGRKDDYYFIAMEYVLGKDLRVILRKLKDLNKTFPEELAISLILKVLTALNYAHTAKDNYGKKLDIVHRDISPPNILVSFDGDVKLTDFGVSKASNKIHQTIAGALKGKLLYMSPEQARGESDIDHRSDLYSVGVILFEQITGEKLFLDPSEMGVLKKVQEGIIVKPSKIKKDIDPELENIILKALSSDKEKRHQNASAMIKDFESYLLKTFDRMPNPSHLAHFVYNLFKNEIAKEDIKIDLKPKPIEIKRISKEKVEMEELKEEKKAKEPEKKEILKVDIEKRKKEEDIKIKKEIIEKEEIYEAPIEIDLDKPKKEMETKKPEPFSTIKSEIISIEKETKKKRKSLLVAVIAIVAVAISIYFIFLKKSSPTKNDPLTNIKLPKTESAQTDTLKKTPIIKNNETGDTIPKDQSNVTGETSMESKEKPDMEPKKEGETEQKIQTKELKQTSKPDLTSKKKTPVKPTTESKKTPTTSKPKIKQKKVEPQKSKQSIKPTSQKDKPDKGTPIKKEIKEPIKTEQKKEEPVEPETKEPEKIEPKKEDITKPEIKEPQKTTPITPVITEGTLLSLSMVDTKPVEISTPHPIIPQNLLGRIKQNVVVRFRINHKGEIETVKLLKKANRKKTNDIIINAIKKWKYKPATKNNVKVRVWETFSFTLKRKN